MTGKSILHLGEHCVETEAKARFRELVNRLLSEEDTTGDLAMELELLRKFIEETDFPALRASDSRLRGEEEAVLCLMEREGGEMELLFEEREPVKK